MSLKSLFSLLSVVVLISGCSGGGAEGQRETHRVTGKVTMGGGPVSGAFVALSPQEGQPVATGRTETDGSYTLTTYEAGDGAVEGNYIAIVTKSAEKKTDGSEQSHDAYASGSFNPSDPSKGGHAADGDEGKPSSSLPEKYASKDTSDLNVTVEAGKENVIDLELQP